MLTTCSETEPSTMRRTPRWPCVPMTIRSALQWSASAMIASAIFAGVPGVSANLLLQRTPAALKRSPARASTCLP
ncbi:hypothetical protein D3C87_1884210 [compost metagenome]